MNEATRILESMGSGATDASSKLMPLVYEELRALAHKYFRNQPADHTLQPTALVHEAFVQLVDRDGVEWTGRAHFLAVAAVAMRGIVVDHARRRRALKRGGDRRRVTICDPVAAESDAFDALAINQAMRDLAENYPRQARVSEMRFFGGMTVKEVAHVLDTSKSTVEEDWRFAKAWLSAKLRGQNV